jgi:hypothetical protein
MFRTTEERLEPGDSSEDEQERSGGYCGGSQHGLVRRRVPAGFIQKFLADEPDVRRQPGHRKRGKDAGARGNGHGFPEGAEFGDVARAGFVIHGTGNEKQRAFVQRMRHEVNSHRLERHGSADTDEESEDSEDADRGVSEDALEVRLVQGKRSTADHAHGANAQQGSRPGIRASQDRIEAREQVDAGLDHGGRVQIRAYRGRRFHGAGQPEMKRELGRFCKGAYENERECGGIQGARANCSAVLKYCGDFESAGHPAYEDNAGKKAEAAKARHEQSLQSSATSFLAIVLESNQ